MHLGTNSSDPAKTDNVPLSVTYDANAEPAYYPSPYATPGLSREQSTNQQNMGTFGSNRTGYAYDIPYPQRRVS